MNRDSRILDSVIEAIGETPLIDLARLASGTGGRILAKVEYLNPGLSKKDRIALQIIRDAESDGSMRPGQTVVELTSGNTGTGLAIVCSILSYPFVAVMSKGNSLERARMMSALGAEVILVDQAPGSTPGQVSGRDLELVEQETMRIVSARAAFRADQFHHAGNFRAHYLHTAQEIIRQTGGAFDAFCDFAGTAGSFAGCAAAFKECREKIRCFVVEPEGAAVLAGRPLKGTGHKIQGGGYSMHQLPLLRRNQVDGHLAISDEDAMHAARRLAKEEGLFAGFSSGANVAAALHLLKNRCRGQTVVILLSDSGLKYLSTDLWATAG